MKMNVKDFYALVDKEIEPVADMLPDLEQLIRKYPYFQAGMFIYLKCLYIADSERFYAELPKLSAFVHDRRALFYYILNEAFEKFRKYTSKPLSEDRTNILINAFFDTQNNISLSDHLEYDIGQTSVASSDYLSYLNSSDEPQEIVVESQEQEELLEVESDAESDISTTEGAPVMKHQNIIDSFIEKAEVLENIKFKLEPIAEDENYEDISAMDEPDSEDLSEELDDDFFFTQTLANIYIKQKKYKRAYEIIKRLNLNYPEKNIYFADQLKFLEKLIKNTSNK